MGELPYQLPPPAVEEILHNASIEVRKVPMGPELSDGTMTLLRFHTFAKVYTVKLDDNGVDTLIASLRGTEGTPDIVIARPGDVPGLRSGQ